MDLQGPWVRRFKEMVPWGGAAREDFTGMEMETLVLLTMNTLRELIDRLEEPEDNEA